MNAARETVCFKRVCVNVCISMFKNNYQQENADGENWNVLISIESLYKVWKFFSYFSINFFPK